MTLKQYLLDHGVEIYATQDESILVAERVRVHLMDSGVVVRDAGEHAELSFVVRSEGHTAPDLSAEAHLSRVRDAVHEKYAADGFTEQTAGERAIEDPGDASKVLDTWYEIRFSKQVTKAELLDQLRYCLAQPKCI